MLLAVLEEIKNKHNCLTTGVADEQELAALGLGMMRVWPLLNMYEEKKDVRGDGDSSPDSGLGTETQ